MATPLKHLAALTRVLPEQRRVAQLADRPVHAEAIRWLGRERTWISDQHLQICRIPAPTFFEATRAEWLRDKFSALGWNAWLDRAGNVLAAVNETPERPVVVSAHLDTVFAPQRPEDISVAPDGRLLGPGVSDNGSGLAALVTLARMTFEMPELHATANSLLLVANVGEEGEGNLSGMRYLCRQTNLIGNALGFVILDGPSTDHITTQALASHRFEIFLAGPGGHSWNDSGTPNAVHALARVIQGFSDAVTALMEGPRKHPRFSYNFGLVEGGATINSIPASARAKLDLRSENSALLDELAAILNSAVERSVEQENRQARGPRPSARVTARIKDLGSRPGGTLAPDTLLMRTIQAVDANLGIRSRISCASTDANVPLSLGLPAISVGSGGEGGGAHTPGEWYSPNGRENGLARILLLLSSLATSEASPTE